jgi:hypothetical protein
MRQTLHQSWCRERAEDYIAASSLKVDNEDRLKIAKAVGSSVQQAVLALKRQAIGDFSPDESAPLGSSAPRATPEAGWREKVAFRTLLDGWSDALWMRSRFRLCPDLSLEAPSSYC